MRGIELSKAYFEQYGMPMLEKYFTELMPYLCAGILGSGSECFGFDDDISVDHDFEAGFCLFLPDEETVDRRAAFLLERAYTKLPSEFMGISRPKLLPVGGARRGVFRISDFFEEKIGSPDGILSVEQWLSVPEQSLAECVNGELFFDSFGEVTAIRERLAHYPEAIRRKKLAGDLVVMAQAGQYNYRRCLDHGEKAAAQLSAIEFVNSALSAIFLLNNKYKPFYKWTFRALSTLPILSEEAEVMEYLLTTPNDDRSAEEKYYKIEGIAADIIDALASQELTNAICGDLEKHAYSVNDGIEDAEIRNMHILAAV